MKLGVEGEGEGLETGANKEEREGGRREGKRRKGGHVFRGMSKVFTSVVTGNASQEISTAIEFTRGIRPYKRRKRESHEVLRSV